MRFLLSIVFVSTLLGQVLAQSPEYTKFWVQFKDKAGSNYSYLKPQEYLSPRALERRSAMGIAINHLDIPVTPAYVQGVAKTGAKVLYPSKWLNGVVVYGDSALMVQVKKLPFVSNVKGIGVGELAKVGPAKMQAPVEYRDDYKKTDNLYGYAQNQVEMLNGHYLIEAGYAGDGKWLAIFDGGFKNVHTMPAFIYLREKNRILGTRDFVEGDDYVYESSTHGTNVLSCIAAKLPYLVMGTAPETSVFLFKTEDVATETLIEEYNWLAAAEYADSLGVDVINSSLGYTHFDYAEMNHEYEDLNGDKAVITRAADWAASKGILVVNSAGNEGSADWHYIGAPADADSVLAIGAVDRNGKRAYFSSWGPTVDGRVKPNVTARGQSTVVASLSDFDITNANGTSFSSPIMAGMATSLWSSAPNASNMEVFEALQKAGSTAMQPDSSFGYGIPDMVKATQFLSSGVVGITPGNNSVHGSPVGDTFTFTIPGSGDKFVGYTLQNNLSYNLQSDVLTLKKGQMSSQQLDLSKLPSGLYTLIVKEGDLTSRVSFLHLQENEPRP